MWRHKIKNLWNSGVPVVHYNHSWFQKWRSHTNLRNWAFSTLNGFAACSKFWTVDVVLSSSQRYGSSLAASSISFNNRFTSKSPMNRVHRVLKTIRDLALVTQRAESALHSKHDRAIFVWPWNENVRTKQKQQTNGNRAIWLVYRTDRQTRLAFHWLSERSGTV